jgi:multiple sugar transport system substrate-binding protein
MQQNCHRFAPLFALLLVGTILAISGCSSARTTAPPSPHRGITLTLACSDSHEAFLKTAARSWQTRNQAGSTTFVSFDPAKPPPADVWVIPGWQLPRWVAEGKLRPLPESLIQRDGASSWPGVLPTYREGLVVWLGPGQSARVPWAVPLLGDAPVLCYRSDLYADPAHQAAYQKETKQALQPPRTWDEFVQQANYFHKNAGLSLPPLPADPLAVERLFGQVAAGYARRPIHESAGQAGVLTAADLTLFQDLETGAPRLDQPGFVHGLKVLKNLQACRAPAGKGDPEEHFLAGKSALCVCEAPWLVRFQEKGSPVQDKVHVLQLPGAEKFVGPAGESEYPSPNRMPYLGTGLLVAVLPADADESREAAAVSLLAHLLDREVSNSVVLSPALAGRVVRSDQLDERIRWDVLGLDREQTKATTEALRGTLLHRSLRNPALALRLPDAEAHRDILVRHLRRALDGADAKSCLEDAAREWRQRMDKLGAETIRNGARLSVGLMP